MTADIGEILEQALSGDKPRAQQIADALADAREAINREFDEDCAVEKLIHDSSALIDRVLEPCFRYFIEDEGKRGCSLVAVGGYGRSELLPGSDIDLMILLDRKPDRSRQQQLSDFLTFLWDIGLEVGHSVRTVKDCVREGKADITVMTTMIESRLIVGNGELYDSFQRAIAPGKIWPARKFFEGKLEEQHNRHLRFNDTAYNLEPNIKEGPGGLRDIQIIGWVAKRHFGARSLKELVEHDFITEAEYRLLDEGQRHLWRVRFALHRIAGRREDRLLFDYQKKIADFFGFESGENNLAIEQFMQQYYRTIMELERVSEMLLQIFREEILVTDAQRKLKPINERFNLRNNFIEVAHADVFKQHPPALMELFLLISLNETCEGVTASTIRLVREHLYLVDDDYRSDETVNRLFMQLMSAPSGMTHQMRRMNSYGFLAAYIPEFASITGRMQYDLFHAYTVDQHIIFVIRNLRRFALDKHEDEFPFCNLVYSKLENPRLLYLAALFHDIAKGRGGDHSLLGAQDATRFCEQHKLNRKETRVVSQLVRDHLLMSVTAQRKDISDPEVVREFAHRVGSMNMLNYLYLLTVADIRSTNPKLWNNWKDALLKQLYRATKTVIRRGIEHAPDIDEIIQENRDAAFETMADLPFSAEQINSVCDRVPGDYFLRHHPLEIKWHVNAILGNPGAARLVSTRQSTYTHNTKVFVYGEQPAHTFSQVTGTLGSLGLSILNAEIFTTSDDKIMDTFIIQDHNGEAVTDPATIELIEKRLLEALESDSIYKSPHNTRKPRQLKAFDHPTEVQFEQDYLKSRTVMEISAMDMPGLLSVIANVIAEKNISITHAKISTLGEKINDIFYLTTPSGDAITDQAMLDSLASDLVQALEAKKAA
jgi:[protein-PII] uridylyltransferase